LLFSSHVLKRRVNSSCLLLLSHSVRDVPPQTQHCSPGKHIRIFWYRARRQRWHGAGSFLRWTPVAGCGGSPPHSGWLWRWAGRLLVPHMPPCSPVLLLDRRSSCQNCVDRHARRGRPGPRLALPAHFCKQRPPCSSPLPWWWWLPLSHDGDDNTCFIL